MRTAALLSLLPSAFALRAPPPQASIAGASARPFVPPGLATIAEPVRGSDALWALSKYQSCEVGGISGVSGPIQTTFCRAGPESGAPAARLLFLHGADSNALEWRFVMRQLSSLGFDCTSLDWWSGGWTSRDEITQVLKLQPTPPQPWVPVREHIRGFWEQHLGGEPLVVVGTSLGGAVAIDFAVQHPECVSALVLVDAGGESYKAPSPDAVTALAPVVLGVKRIAAWVQARVPSEDVRLIALHRTEPGWLEAGGEYLRSGSYQREVGPERIRQVRAKTLVIWGEDDDILPVEDAAAFARDLPDCAAVEIIPGSGHSPQLDNPPPVARLIREFVAAL